MRGIMGWVLAVCLLFVVALLPDRAEARGRRFRPQRRPQTVNNFFFNGNAGAAGFRASGGHHRRPTVLFDAFGRPVLVR